VEKLFAASGPRGSHASGRQLAFNRLPGIFHDVALGPWGPRQPLGYYSPPDGADEIVSSTGSDAGARNVRGLAQ